MSESTNTRTEALAMLPSADEIARLKECDYAD